MRMRLIEPGDLDACLTTWPIHGVAHDVAIGALGHALASERAQGTVLEQSHGNKLLAFGISTFVRGATIEQAAHANLPLVALVLNAELSGRSAMLKPGMAVDAARAQDLHLLVLAYRQSSFDMNDSLAREQLRLGHVAFRLMHEGHPLRGAWQEGDTTDSDWMRSGGFLIKRTYVTDGPPARLLFGTLREEVTSSWPSHTISFLFQDCSARLGLTPMQRRVATLALWGHNDAQVSQRLAISSETVRRHWRGIFERIEETSPMLLADPPRAGADTGRGPEKRARVLEFLRNNLHEVRVTAGTWG